MATATRPLTDIERAIIDEYSRFGTPADQLALNHELGTAFCRRLRLSCPTAKAMEEEEIIALTVRLRKKGMLPRLQRAFAGRKPHPR